MVLPHLREIAKSLCSAPAAGEAHHRDPYLFRSIVLLAISSSLAVNGTLFLLRPHFFEDAFLVDIGHIAGLAVLSGAAILGLLLLANMWLLGRSARGHLILLELLLVGFFGAVASSAAELRDANIEWDRGPAQQLNPRVTSKTIQHSRKGGPTYQLHVVDWNNPGTTRKIKVSRSFYDSVRPGQHLVVHQHPGRLGARWARIHGAGAT